MIKKIALCLLVAAPLSAPAVAAPNPAASSARTDQLQSLESAARVSPNDSGAQIELAQGYLRANRPAEARNAYRRALSLDNEMMETPSGDAIWSHDVATRALTGDPQLSAR